MDGAVESNHKPVIPDEAYGVGDTFLILSVLPPELADTAFGALQEEVKWNTMAHRGEQRTYCFRSSQFILRSLRVGGEVPRLISVQGDIAADGRQALLIDLMRNADKAILVAFRYTAIQPTSHRRSSHIRPQQRASVTLSKENCEKLVF